MAKMLWIWSAIIANAVWSDWESKLEVLWLVEWYAIGKCFNKTFGWVWRENGRCEWGTKLNLKLLTHKYQLINNCPLLNVFWKFKGFYFDQKSTNHMLLIFIFCKNTFDFVAKLFRSLDRYFISKLLTQIDPRPLEDSQRAEQTFLNFILCVLALGLWQFLLLVFAGKLHKIN